MGIWYTSREDVQRALDDKSTARDNAQIDRQIEAESRDIDGFLHRSFAPTVATRYFDWPNSQMGRSYRLWLDENELIAPTSITSGSTVLAPADYFLEPVNSGPPYDRLEVDLGSQGSFDTGSTHQRDIAIAGLFGYTNVERSVGALSASLAADPAATASATFTTARIGVGDVLRIDNERCVVTAKTLVSSTQTLQTPIGASNAETLVAVTNGLAFAVDAVLLLDAERMLVIDIAGNNLIVKRAWTGSVLAAHTGSTIYTQSGIELDRAQLGTTIAVHNIAAVIYQWQVPALVRQLCIAEVLNTFEQESAGYARTVGSGDNVRNASGAGIDDLRKRTYRAHGRKARIAVV